MKTLSQFISFDGGIAVTADAIRALRLNSLQMLLVMFCNLHDCLTRLSVHHCVGMNDKHRQFRAQTFHKTSTIQPIAKIIAVQKK